MLHGMGGTAMNAHQETGWSAKGEAECFIVAYPEGTRPSEKAAPSLRKNPQAWNDGSGRFHFAEKNIDDVAFIGSMLDRISADYNIDPDRIYITGFSNGASMAFRVGAELSDRVAAIAPCAGACWTDELKLTGKTSLCYITGTADKLNPMEGGYPKLNFGSNDQGGKKKPAVQLTISKWVEALKCGNSPTNDTSKDGVRVRRYGPSDRGSEVEFITVDDLGHHWAGGASQAPEFLVGKNTNKIRATDAIWSFFQAHSK
jgi:polyhydroxybutyrate depolymerase